MKDKYAIKSPDLAVLQELFSAATHEASAAMCRWTNGLITLNLDEVREIPMESVHQELEWAHDLVTMVVLTLSGEVGGDMILVFDDLNGRRLSAALLGRSPSETAEWSPLEKSALTETGNILGCAYLNALTRLIDAELVPSPPYFIQDYGASVLDQALTAQAMSCDQALICRTGFHRAGEELNWHVLFLPTPALRRRLEEALYTSR
jgi:chemotaxis protein CheC